MLEGVKVLGHSSVKMKKDKVIYIDPYQITQNYNDADVIFITHSHYDHFSEEDIEKVKKDNTIFVVTNDIFDKLIEDGYNSNNIIVVEPNQKYETLGIKFETVASYNINKPFHPKENNWVGYVIEINGERYYIAGDTDVTEEDKNVKCDMAFVPVGGTYTMTHKEAADLVNILKPKIAVPIHYGSVVGAKEDADMFIRELRPNIQGINLMK